jgi:hypothetical protein
MYEEALEQKIIFFEVERIVRKIFSSLLFRLEK